MSDEVGYYPMKMIQHIKIWASHQFLAEIKFYWPKWFHGQSDEYNVLIMTECFFRGYPTKDGQTKTIYCIYFFLFIFKKSILKAVLKCIFVMKLC